MRSPALAAVLALATTGLVGRADAPAVHAVVNARLVTVSGPAVERGTIVMRGGVIEAAGASVAAPPDAVVIDGAGLTVYPGLIDMGNETVVDVPPISSGSLDTMDEVDRHKRQACLRADLLASEHLKVDRPDLHRLASAGITSVLAVPAGEIITGQSALVNVVAQGEEPKIGNVSQYRAGRFVVRSPVALHVKLNPRPRGSGYPNSLLGSIAFVRQAFIDARYYKAENERFGRAASGPRPVEDPALAAMAGAASRAVPTAIEANGETEIVRALREARTLEVDAVITGGLEAGAVAAELKAAGVPVILSLNYPERPISLAPGADEPLRDVERRANAPKTAGALEAAGVAYAFESGGLKEPSQFVGNAAKAVKAGLSKEGAIRALTLGAARIARVDRQLGTLESGKIANVIVTSGDLFEEGTSVKHVFVDGRPVRLDAPPTETRTTGQR